MKRQSAALIEELETRRTIERLAEWLYRYVSQNHRPQSWYQLCREAPELADAFRRDARRCAAKLDIIV